MTPNKFMNFTSISGKSIKAFGMIACLFGLAWANEVSAVKEDLKILVQSVKGDDGKPKIKCALLNNSAYTFASSNAKTGNGQFQIRLRDEAGKIIPQVAEWAEGFDQIGSNSHEHPRSFVPIIIAPGGKFEFQFDLYEAYGDRVPLGQKLEVEWDSYWPQDIIDVPVEDPKTGDQHREKQNAHFQGKWNIAVTASITEGGEITGESHNDADPLIDPKVNTPERDHRTKEGPPKEPKMVASPAASSFSWPVVIGIGISIAAILGIGLFLAAGRSKPKQ